MSRKIVLGLGLVAALALPASAAAKPPSKADKRHAAKECKAERGTDEATREAFEGKYRSFGACVRAGAREERAERREARRSARDDCRTEREEMGAEAFREEYGTNRNKRNAFGKCVSGKVRQERAAERREDREEIAAERNAAKTCAAEREEIGADAFAEKYGTNGNKRNAFGKCVSAAVSEEEGEPETDEQA